MRIAMLGTRGVPASYSGFETCVEELGSRLADRGHEVTVYCRAHHITYDRPMYKGMRLVKLPTIANKYLDTIVHSLLSTLDLTVRRADIALYFIAGNSPVTWLPRLTGMKSVLNVDGLDWKRDKWPPLAKRYIQAAEYLATILPNVVVTDSRVVQAYYRQRYGAEARYIAYGSDVTPLPPGPYLAQFGLTPRRYILFVGRLVPENCAHHLVEAFNGLRTDFKCVVVGDAPYADDYKAWLRGLAGPNVVFTGYLFGEGYRELSSNAYAFVETSGVGGTHPALLEAMAFGNCVVAHNTAENLETMGPAGLAYAGRLGAQALRVRLAELLTRLALVEEYRSRAAEWVQQHYSWERVTDEYEALFQRLLRAP